MVAELFQWNALCKHSPKKGLIAFLQSAVFEKMKKTHFKSAVSPR